MQQRGSRILILGGGFAGVYTALALRDELRGGGAGSDAKVAMVNRENFFVFYPLLPEIISGAIETEHVLNPIRLIVPHAHLYVGDVVAIDLPNGRVEIRHGLYQHQQTPRTLYYDHLVLALGGIPSTSRIPGLAEFAFDVQRLSNAFALRNHIIDFLVTRSKTFTAETPGHDPRNVPVVRPGLNEPAIVVPPRAIDANSAQAIAR